MADLTVSTEVKARKPAKLGRPDGSKADAPRDKGMVLAIVRLHELRKQNFQTIADRFKITRNGARLLHKRWHKWAKEHKRWKKWEAQERRKKR